MKSTKRKTKIKYILVIIPITIVLVFFAGNWYFNKDRQIETLIGQATSGSFDEMKKSMVYINGEPLSNEGIKGLQRLYGRNNDTVRQISGQIRNGKSNSMFHAKKTGKYFGIFDKYQIEVKQKNLHIWSYIDDGTSFYIGDQKSVFIDDDYEHLIEGLTPGIYKLKTNNSDLENNKEVSISIKDEKDSINVFDKE